MSGPTAFEPATVGGVGVSDRAVMAPMTCSRVDEDGAPTDLAATCCAQRVSAGPVITEGIQPGVVGQGCPPVVCCPKMPAGW